MPELIIIKIVLYISQILKNCIIYPKMIILTYDNYLQPILIIKFKIATEFFINTSKKDQFSHRTHCAHAINIDLNDLQFLCTNPM